MSSSTITQPLSDLWSQSGQWQVVRGVSGLQLDNAAAQLLSVNSTGNLVAADDLQRLGPAVSSRSAANMSCGQWLEHCFTNHQPGAALLRCATDNGTILDASLQGDTLQVRNSPVAERYRQLHHELANRMNNIHVNAQLVRLWAQQRADDALQEAAERIMKESADTLDSAVIAVGQLKPDEGPSCNVATVLPALLYRSGAHEPSLDLAVRHSAEMPSGTLLHIAHFLNRVAQRVARPLTCRTEPLANHAALEICIRDPAIADAGSAILEHEWHSREDDQLAFPNMSRAVDSFTLTCSGDLLRLTVH